MLSASELASMNSVIASSLDVTITVQRKSTGQDSYGHANASYATVGTAKCNVVKPSATVLQAYADVIGTQLALVIRFMPTSDIREGDQIVYNSKSWRVQNILSAESYTFANEALITVVA